MAGCRRNGGHDDGDLMPFPLTRLPCLAPSPIVPTHELSLVCILGRKGGAVRQWRREGSDPLPQIVGAHGRDRAPEVVTGRPKSGHQQISDTAHMRAFNLSTLIQISCMVAVLGAVSSRLQAFFVERLAHIPIPYFLADLLRLIISRLTKSFSA